MSTPARRRTLLAASGGLALLLAAGAVIAVAHPFGDSGEPSDGAAGSTSLATVQRGRLAARVDQSGTLGFAGRRDGSPYSVVNQAIGTYSALPAAGEVVGCGHALYRVANEPVVLLCGKTPIYRSLSAGMSGPDVRELNANLVRLGYATRAELDPASDDFGWATTAALRELQDDLDVDQTGTLDPGEVVFLPGPLRITKVTATLGSAAGPGAVVAQASSTRRQVVVDLDPSQQSDVEVGDRAQITLPGNRTTPGVVTRIGVVAKSGGGDAQGSGSETTLPVYVALRRPKDAHGLDQAPVRVRITTDGVKDALIVPVTALVARAGGGYAVETVARDGATHRLVGVTLGLFDDADGLVQVTGSGLAAGQRVVVPAS